MATLNTLDSQQIVSNSRVTSGGDNNLTAVRIPTIGEIVSGARKAGADITHNTKRFVNWYSNLGFAEKAIFSQIPFLGDTIDLAIQAHRLASGKGVDPVVVVLSSLGLGADVAAGATLGGLQGINASIALVKASYQSMSQLAKTGLKAIFEAASNSPGGMRGLRDLIPELASLAGSGKLSKLLEDPKVRKFAILKLTNSGLDKIEDFFKNKDKSRIDVSKNNEKSFVAFDVNNGESLPKQRYDVVVAKLEEQKISPTKKNIESVLTQTSLSPESIEDVLIVAKQAAVNNTQSTLG